MADPRALSHPNQVEIKFMWFTASQKLIHNHFQVHGPAPIGMLQSPGMHLIHGVSSEQKSDHRKSLGVRILSLSFSLSSYLQLLSLSSQAVAKVSSHLILHIFSPAKLDPANFKHWAHSQNFKPIRYFCLHEYAPSLVKIKRSNSGILKGAKGSKNWKSLRFGAPFSLRILPQFF